MKKKHKRRLAVLERIVAEQSARIARLETEAGIPADVPLAGTMTLNGALADQLKAAVAAVGRASLNVEDAGIVLKKIKARRP